MVAFKVITICMLTTDYSAIAWLKITSEMFWFLSRTRFWSPLEEKKQQQPNGKKWTWKLIFSSKIHERITLGRRRLTLSNSYSIYSNYIWITLSPYSYQFFFGMLHVNGPKTISLAATCIHSRHSHAMEPILTINLFDGRSETRKESYKYVNKKTNT